jgi:hypothetical protein
MKPEPNTWPIKMGLKSFNAQLNGKSCWQFFCAYFAKKVTATFVRFELLVSIYFD